MAALGFLLYFVGWGIISWIITCTFIPAGAVLFIVGSSGRSGDDDIDDYIALHTRELDPGLDLDKNFAKRISKHRAPVEIRGYEFGEDLMYAKMKNGTVRTSEYTASVIYMLIDGLYIVSRNISLISDEERADKIFELPYGEIDRVTLSSETKNFIFNKKSFTAKDTRLCIDMKGGDSVSLPIHDDLNSEQLVENIDRILKNYKKENPIG